MKNRNTYMEEWIKKKSLCNPLEITSIPFATPWHKFLIFTSATKRRFNWIWAVWMPCYHVIVIIETNNNFSYFLQWKQNLNKLQHNNCIKKTVNNFSMNFYWIVCSNSLYKHSNVSRFLFFSFFLKCSISGMIKHHIK